MYYLLQVSWAPLPKPTKKQIRCGICRVAGHTARRCPSLHGHLPPPKLRKQLKDGEDLYLDEYLGLELDEVLEDFAFTGADLDAFDQLGGLDYEDDLTDLIFEELPALSIPEPKNLAAPPLDVAIEADPPCSPSSSKEDEPSTSTCSYSTSPELTLLQQAIREVALEQHDALRTDHEAALRALVRRYSRL